MKSPRAARSPRDRHPHLSANAERLVACALGMGNSGSRVEDRFWDNKLSQLLDPMLDSGMAQPVYEALERLHQTDHDAYGALIEAVEESAESTVIEHDGQRWQVLLVSAPLVCWTRFQIPSGNIDPASCTALADAWCNLVAAPGARLFVQPALLSIDQLPRDCGALRLLTNRLAMQAVTGQAPDGPARALPDSAAMLADTRFLLGALAVPAGQPLFRWQLAPDAGFSSRVHVLEKWVELARPVASSLLPGCGFECLLPDAFHINLREADRRVRPYSIRAAVHYLTHALNVSAQDIRATIAGFGTQRCDEYRIGLGIDPDGEELAHGVVWPLLGAETEQDEPAPVEQIRELLRESGVSTISRWSGLTEPEFCEDCGAPLFPNEKEDVVHAHLPSEPVPESAHFH